MSEPIKHAVGPFWESAHCLVAADGGLICEKILDRGDYLLLLRADHAPHICEDRHCPGDINRRKLESWPDLLAACEAALAEFVLGDCRTNVWPIREMARAAIAKARGI